MSRGVEERNRRAVKRNGISTDMLRDTACLTAGDVGLSDVVEQRRFAVVDVSHNGNDRRTRNEVVKFFLVVHFELCREGIFECYVGFVFEFDAKFVRDEFRSGKIDVVVDGLHNTEDKQRFDDFRSGFADFFAQSLDRHGVCGDNCVFDNNGCTVSATAVFIDFVVAYDHFAVFVVRNSIVNDITPFEKRALVHSRAVVKLLGI